MTCCNIYRSFFRPTFTKIGTCVIKIGTHNYWYVHVITGIISCEETFATVFPPLFIRRGEGESESEGKGKGKGKCKGWG